MPSIIVTVIPWDSGIGITSYTTDNPNYLEQIYQDYVNIDEPKYLSIKCKIEGTDYEWEYTFKHECGHSNCNHTTEYHRVLGGNRAEQCMYFCSEHCVHSKCESCHQHDVTICEHCSLCIGGCCECLTCDTCGELSHSGCGYCDNHCRCESSEECKEGRGFIADLKHLKQFKCKRTVGIEWEYNKAPKPLHNWAFKWRGGIHYDGSCGWEAVTPPLSGDYIRQCISDLGQDLSEAAIDGRCSVHVHVDASDYLWSDMYRLLKVYSHLEPVLYLLGGQNRCSNRQYCEPCGNLFINALNHKDRKSAVLSIAYSTGYDYGRSCKRGGAKKKAAGRYKGLNICPWIAGKNGKTPDTTVEFRIHRDTNNSKRVYNWAELCALIVDWTQNSSDIEVKNFPKSPLQTLCTIVAPSKSEWILERVKAWRKDTRPKKRRIQINGGYKLVTSNNEA